MAEGNFECDRKTKDEFVALVKRLFKDYNLIIDVPYDPQSPIDVYFTAYTDTVKATYACELKERWGRYDSTSYGADWQEGWVLEGPKFRTLMESAEEGYNPIYVNLYPDDLIRIWNLNKISDFGSTGKKEWNRHTVDDEGGRYVADKITVFNRDAKEYKRWN